jgi:hypothetical protein
MATTTQELQAQMRRDPNGRLICEQCGGPVTKGWVYKWGGITLATCGKQNCQPPAPPWIHGCDFIPTRNK